jgi:uncharacterized protein involved in exopolysaccharide biosynthesis
MDINDRFHRLPEQNGLANGPFVDGALRSRPHPHVTVELIKYWRLLRRHLWLIGCLTIAAMALSVAYNKLLVTPLYQAQAVITPVPPDQDMSQISGMGGMLDSGGGGLASMLMGTSDNDLVSERDIAILNSFDFTNGLVRRYGAAKLMDPADASQLHGMSPWKIYQTINGELNTDYDYKTGNLTLSYVLPDREQARQVLGYYLEALRERLRSEEVKTAAAAADSLKEEVTHTSDSLLQAQLYELMARQIQREKLAQVQADFAFKLVEPPMTPDARYSPHVIRSAAFAGFVALFLICAGIIVREWLAHAHAHLNAQAGLPLHVNDPALREATQPAEAERFVFPHKA